MCLACCGVQQPGGFKPIKLFSIDRVFRNESLDATHLAEFHQVGAAWSCLCWEPGSVLHPTAPHRTAPHPTAPHRTALHGVTLCRVCRAQIEGVVADYGIGLGDLIGVITEFFSRVGTCRVRAACARPRCWDDWLSGCAAVCARHQGDVPQERVQPVHGAVNGDLQQAPRARSEGDRQQRCVSVSASVSALQAVLVCPVAHVHCVGLQCRCVPTGDVGADGAARGRSRHRVGPVSGAVRAVLPVHVAPPRCGIDGTTRDACMYVCVRACVAALQ